jgi:hypothetical protein
MITVFNISARTLYAFAASQLLIMATANANEQDVPTGWITATPGVVKAGTYPTLRWNIQYPSLVEDYITIEPPGLIETKERLQMTIRVLGAGVTASRTDGSDLRFVHTEAWFRLGNNSWSRLFAGINDDVQQDHVAHSSSVNAHTKVRFGGRFWFNNQWSTFYSSNDGTSNVRVLKNGDEVPTTYALSTAPSLEDFIKPYLDASGRVRIGPMDTIVMMELTHTDAQRHELGYDLQDMVLLISFRPI